MIRKVLLGSVLLLVIGVLVVLVLVAGRHEAFPDAPSVVSQVPPDTPLAVDTRAAIDELLAEQRSATNQPSISAAIGLDGRLAYASAHGYADMGRAVPATPEHLYRIGSVSKSITAVALGAMMERGQIDVDAEFHQYVAGFPEKRWPFTLRQLASHTAGVRHYRDSLLQNLGETFHDEHYDNVREPLALVADDPLLFEPGTQYSYSSYGYNMLSAAMAAAGGEPFTAQLERFVFAPAGMTEIHAEDAPNPHPDSVSYYLHYDGENIRAPYADNSYKVAGGGLVASPAELVAFGNALLGGALVSDAIRAELFAPVALSDGSTEPQSYGLGFGSSEYAVGEQTFAAVGHGGGSVGGRTAFVMFPEVPLVVAVTINADGNPYPAAYGIAELILTSRASEPPAAL